MADYIEYRPQFLLAAWSVTTPIYIQYNYLPYRDTPRSFYEKRRIMGYQKPKPRKD